jgi:hypothetical protein
MRLGFTKLLAVAGLTTVVACAPTPPPAPPRPPAPAPAPAPAPMVMPTPPNSASPTLVLPVVDGLGRRMTPNVDLSPEQALWQLRIGLNVAALSCRGPDEVALVNNYTAFLTRNQRAIAAAERWVIRDQGVRNGTNGIAARDALSTRMYNYFAQPPVKTEFCIRATQIMGLAAAEPTTTILPFGAAQIVQLDQPFVDFYAAYARYQANFAVWRSQQPVAPLAPVMPPAPAMAPPPAPTPPPVAPSPR